MKPISKLNNANTTDSEVSLSPIRVKRGTFEKMITMLAQVNKKEFGKRVRSDDLVSFALSLVTDAHIKELQDSSLTNYDRFEAMYKDHIAKKGQISKDAFLGLLLNKKISNLGSVSA